MSKIFCLTLFILVANIILSQELMTVGKEKVSKDEFLRIYRKNNSNAINYSEKNINEYVDLFSLFKMKLQEARRLKLDTITAVREDYDKYTDQLVQNYYVDKNYVENILREQYEYMKSDVKVAHIMVKCNPTSSPSDTLLAYNKLNFIYNQVNPENFAKLAKENSEDQATASKGGVLGFITAFMTFPDFEKQCYTTPVKGISPIFRTQYGYHILHILEKRPARGRVKVAHIYLKKSDKNDEEKRMNEIYQQIKSKKISFDEAVKKYSEDASTQNTKGELQEFGVSEMVTEFEEACYALNRKDDISSPFKTEYGWHLVRLIEKKGVLSYDESKDIIRQKLARDTRITNLRGIAYQRMISSNQFQENTESLKSLTNSVNDSFFNVANWNLASSKELDGKALFNYAGKSFTIKEFKNFANNQFQAVVSKKKGEILNAMYQSYKERMIWETTKNILKIKDTSFAALESEYMNGLLIFEIMDREIWKKAVKDTVGIKKIYEEVKNNYWYKERVVLEGVKTRKAELPAKYITSFNQNAKSLLNMIKKSSDSNEFVYYEKTIEKGDNAIVDVEMAKGSSPFVFQEDEKSTILAKIIKILPPAVKPLEEVRGRIQNLYQNKIEKDWTNSLRAKYPVTINKAELSKIIQK